MRKCIHGQVRPCHICKHDYDRAAPYVVDDPPESLQRCYAVIEALQAKNVGLESALADIREVYAGSEGIPVAETCAEAYVIRLIEQMYSIAVEALTPTSAGDE